MAGHYKFFVLSVKKTGYDAAMSKQLWFVLAVLDALTMSLLCAWLTLEFVDQRIALAGDFIGLQKAYNPGIAFGFDLGPLQTPIVLIVLLIVAVSGWKNSKSVLEAIGFGCIAGGGLANVIDRALDGFVTDVVQIGSFPIFNVADTYINIGIALLLLHLLRESSVLRQGKGSSRNRS